MGANIGYPVMLKAVAGGGGRGMRIVRTADELPALFQQASGEAAGAFGNGDLYMEKFIERPRHIEFQVLADEHGNVLSLGERECSIQRRHQKLIEEAPSLMVSPKLRAELGQTIAALPQGRRLLERRHHRVPHGRGRQDLLHRDEHPHPGRALRHRDGHRHRPGQGADPHRRRREALRHRHQPGRHHRPRHRVPHQRRAPRKVHPSAGNITAFNLPGGNGVRVDTAQYAEGVVPPYYDSLIAKLICHGEIAKRR